MYICIYYTIYTHFEIFLGVWSEWVVFYLGQSKTTFFIYGIIQFGPKAGLASVGKCETLDILPWSGKWILRLKM